MPDIIVVYGAPCSGKSYYVDSVITGKDIRYDYDLIKSAISNANLHEMRDPLRNICIGLRGVLIDMVMESNTDKLYIISCKITEKLTEQLPGYGVIYKLIHADKQECFRRLEADSTRINKAYWRTAIEDWFEWYESCRQYAGRQEGI